MSSRRFPMLAACALVAVFGAPGASAEPGSDVVAVPASDVPTDDGRIVSAPPQRTDTPDGWTLALSAKAETQVASAPLTTAVSSREYVVGGTYDGTLRGPDDSATPNGTMEVGYQIGCGVDMSTSNGVALTGTVGVTPSLGLGGIDVASPLPEGLLPVISTPMTGGITIGLKPGIVNVVPVTKKQFEGFDPWVMISNFHIKIDGCVGQSFIRSYAYLTRSTRMSDSILAYYGTTKVV